MISAYCPFFKQCLWWGHQEGSMPSAMGGRQHGTLHLFLLMLLDEGCCSTFLCFKTT